MGCAVLIVMSTQISWQLTLLALLPMPLMALAIKRNGDALHERFRVAQAAFSSLNDRTQESLTSIRMIKAFGLEDRQSALLPPMPRIPAQKYARGAHRRALRPDDLYRHRYC